ncbi:MAG: sulfotransferase family 2 domain-containing protein [bacterium]|nr:sulfotransferase family 2 domain-containing protein [bacterium]
MRDCLIFLHLPRAAGTTIQLLLDRLFPVEEIYSIASPEMLSSFGAFAASPEPERAKTRVLRGHMPFGIHQHVPGRGRYFTILREPVARVISMYRYTRRTPVHYLHERVCGEGMSLADYVAGRLTTEIDNGQTRLLSGRLDAYVTVEEGTIREPAVAFGECTPAMLEEARQNLAKHFEVVGLCERFPETFMLLRQAFGWPLWTYSSASVSAKPSPREPTPPEVVEWIRECNRFDFELYEYGRELFRDQLARWGTPERCALAWHRSLQGARRVAAAVTRPGRRLVRRLTW